LSEKILPAFLMEATNRLPIITSHLIMIARSGILPEDFKESIELINRNGWRTCFLYPL